MDVPDLNQSGGDIVDRAGLGLFRASNKTVASTIYQTKNTGLLLQLRVLRFRLPVHGDVEIGVFPKSEKILIRFAHGCLGGRYDFFNFSDPQNNLFE